MRSRILLVLPLVTSLLGWSQAGQNPIIVPEMLGPVTSGVFAFKDTPADLKLVPKEAGGRTGQLWIRNIGTGLLIAGQVDGPAAQLPRASTEMLSRDHVEIWLATALDLSLPPIGWGNQFQEEELPEGPDSCADWAKQHSPGEPDTTQEEKDCRTWATRQQQYRSMFKKLFVRQWLLAPNIGMEAYATPAFDLIREKYPAGKNSSGPMLQPLKPAGLPRMSFSVQPSGYSFQIQIPYSAFPPINTLRLENVWLMVDVFNSAPSGKKMGAFSSSSAVREYGKPQTFNQLRLQPMQVFRMSPCGDGLEGADKYRHSHPGWFIPKQHPDAGLETDSFILVNEASGYAYEPAGFSPVVRSTHHFWRSLGANEWVCGPALAYQKDQDTKRYDQWVEQDAFGAHRNSDGIILIKSGPAIYYSEFGSGECGACPRYGLQILALDPSLNLKQALALGGVVRGENDAVDFSLSADWSQVVQYQEAPSDHDNPDASGTWTATSYCLKGLEYVECGVKKNVQPPHSPLLKQLESY